MIIGKRKLFPSHLLPKQFQGAWLLDVASLPPPQQSSQESPFYEKPSMQVAACDRIMWAECHVLSH